jgi:hypothetical protein
MGGWPCASAALKRPRPPSFCRPSPSLPPCPHLRPSPPGPRPPAPPPQPLLVSITLSKLTEASINLFVRAELLLPPGAAADASERRAEATLLGISRMAREKYGAVLLW